MPFVLSVVRMPVMPTRLIEIVRSLAGKRIVLLGDLMLDRYIYGNAERLSPEAPVPVLHVQREDVRLGGAGRVAADLATLGADVRVIGFIGRDETGAGIRKLLKDYGANLDGLIELPDRPSTGKVRLIGLAQHRHPQQMIRLDYEDTRSIGTEMEAKLLANLERALDGAGGLCIEDYHKGLLTDSLCRAAIDLARKRNVPVFVDPANIADYGKYRGASAITPNRAETEKAASLPCQSEDQYRPAAEKLLSQLDLDAAILTLDRHGAYLATRDGQRRWLATKPRNVYDVAGAGDMVLAMLAMARAAGASWEDAVALANIAGGLEVEKFGSVPITPDEIVAEILAEAGHKAGKQRPLDQLLVELQRHRAAGRRIVFTNGCFDLIHMGHVKYFQFARDQGDLLVVGVNSDDSIRRLKGEKRPIVAERDRLSVLEELESINFLVTFDQDTPLELIAAIRPDVLVKGADYSKQQVVGWDVVESYGGKIALAPLVDGRSTSAVIERILEAYK